MPVVVLTEFFVDRFEFCLFLVGAKIHGGHRLEIRCVETGGEDCVLDRILGCNCVGFSLLRNGGGGDHRSDLAVPPNVEGTRQILVDQLPPSHFLSIEALHQAGDQQRQGHAFLIDQEGLQQGRLAAGVRECDGFAAGDVIVSKTQPEASSSRQFTDHHRTGPSDDRSLSVHQLEPFWNQVVTLQL